MSFTSKITRALSLAVGEVRQAFADGEEALVPGAATVVANRPAPALRSWDQVPLIAHWQQQLMCGGDPQAYKNPFHYAIERWGGQLPLSGLQVLCLGCSQTAPVEEWLLATRRIGRIVVVDNDEDLLEKRRRQYARAGFPPPQYLRVDLNRDPLPRGPFHVVAAYDTIHSLAELEWVFAQLAEVLVPGGLFAAREYVGPNRMQFTAAQMNLVNALFVLLPEDLRRDPGGMALERQTPPDLGWLMEIAPTKAIRSEDLLAVVRSRLKILENVALGGTLLAPLLAGIANRFRAATPESDAVLAVLMDIEEILIQAGMLTSDTCFVIARRTI